MWINGLKDLPEKSSFTDLIKKPVNIKKLADFEQNMSLVIETLIPETATTEEKQQYKKSLISWREISKETSQFDFSYVKDNEDALLSRIMWFDMNYLKELAEKINENSNDINQSVERVLES